MQKYRYCKTTPQNGMHIFRYTDELTCVFIIIKQGWEIGYTEDNTPYVKRSGHGQCHYKVAKGFYNFGIQKKNNWLKYIWSGQYTYIYLYGH